MTLQASNIDPEILRQAVVEALRDNPQALTDAVQNDPVISSDLRNAFASVAGTPLGVPQTVEYEHSGYTRLYNRKNGEASNVLTSMVAGYMSRRFEDGELVWSREPMPELLDPDGIVLCPLHVDSPQKDHYRSLGVPVDCDHPAFKNEFFKEEHMRRRHPRTFALSERSEQLKRENNQQSQAEIFMNVMSNFAEKLSISGVKPEEVSTVEQVIEKAEEIMPEITPEVEDVDIMDQIAKGKGG